MRFCPGCIMRINHNNELKDTASYSQIKDLKVLPDHFLDLNFTPGCPDEKWQLYFEDSHLEEFVKDMAQRKYNMGDTLSVTFDSGVKKFDYEPTVTAAERERQFGGGKKGGPKSAGGNKYQNAQSQHDAFMADMLADLDTIGDMNAELNNVLGEHVDALKEQQGLVKQTDDRTKALNKRADKWLAANK